MTRTPPKTTGAVIKINDEREYLRVSRTDKRGHEHEDLYEMTRGAPIPGLVRAMVDLRKTPDGDNHRVIEFETGEFECTCQAFVMGRNEFCKHLQALVDVGLFKRQ